MCNKFDSFDITTGTSLKNISHNSCMYLSVAIENGFMLSANPNDNTLYF